MEMNNKLPSQTSTRRPIPRPWLKKKPITADDTPELVEELSLETLLLQRADILLDKKPAANPIQSLFHKMQWCKGFCLPPQEEHENTFELSASQEAAFERPKSSNTLAYSVSVNTNDQSSKLVENLAQQKSHRNEGSSDVSSVVFASRPAEIYITHRENADTSEAIPPPESLPCKNWHQSYLPFFSDRPPALVLERGSSSTTTITFDDEDSKAISVDLNPPVSRPRRRMTTLPSFPSLPGSQRRKVSKPPLQRSKTASMPPIPRPMTLKTAQRAATGGSISNRHRSSRSQYEIDDDSLNRVYSSDRECDSSIATESCDFSLDGYDDDSPIFPGLSDCRDPYYKSSWPEDSDIDSRQDSYCIPQDENSVYLAKCPLFDNLSSPPEVSALLSGWVAYSLGDTLLHKRKISGKYLAYLVVNGDEAETMIRLKQPPSGNSKTGESTGERDTGDLEVPLPPGTRVQTIDSACGRCVLLVAGSRIICTLLPVHVPSTPSVMQKTTKQLARLKTRSSVAQHDAALHLWFGLDGWLHRRAVHFS
mmetsp:Transcript_18550/g.27510  ORF Transcript_18550/g.27510 Transcript_18550/m.27510 type:complete len:536 (-) Transcript_18550:24-1631(-)